MRCWTHVTVVAGRVAAACVLKPLRQGSSVGLEFVDRRETSPRLERSLRHDARCCSRTIAGMETTVGILDASVAVSKSSRGRRLRLHEQVHAGPDDYYCRRLSGATTARVQAAALGAYHAIGARDYARVDVMVTRTTSRACSR